MDGCLTAWSTVKAAKRAWKTREAKARREAERRREEADETGAR